MSFCSFNPVKRFALKLIVAHALHAGLVYPPQGDMSTRKNMLELGDMCPVCTVTVIAGLGLSRLLGIDDVITSIWIGAFVLSFSFVTTAWIDKKWPKLEIGKWKLQIIALMYLLVLVPLKLNGSVGIAGNILWGIDKILFGTVIGSASFLIGIWIDKKVRKDQGKQLFDFQKVVFPVLAIIISSLVFYFVTK